MGLLGGCLVTVGLVLAVVGAVDLDAWDAVKLGLGGVLVALTLLGLRRHDADPQPRLRLSADCPRRANSLPSARGSLALTPRELVAEISAFHARYGDVSAGGHG